jgi:hypothetical protein
MPEVSTTSNDTDDGEGVFVFHQLGTLEYFAGDSNQIINMYELGRGIRLSTGFCVFVRFSSASQSTRYAIRWWRFAGGIRYVS